MRHAEPEGGGGELLPAPPTIAVYLLAKAITDLGFMMDMNLVTLLLRWLGDSARMQ